MQKLTKQEAELLHAVGSSASASNLQASTQLPCVHCGQCTHRCEVLSGPSLDMGEIKAAYERIALLPEDEQVEATQALMMENYALYNALRQCCFCGSCTAACQSHLAAPEDMRVWRELFSKAGFMPPEASRLVMVDNEWDIFSAYRAIYQIAYPEFVSLAQAAEEGRAGRGIADTLFFPGCSLVTYAPEIVRAVGAWMNASGVKWALSEGCCGSPLMSAGLFERAGALRQKFIDQMVDAGITRMVTVCPGCADEFRADLPASIELIPLPELIAEIAAKRAEAGEDTGLHPLSLSSVSFFDSCHDRSDMRNANALRTLFAVFMPETQQRELDHHGRNALCCGAGGAVAAYDADITERRVWRIIDEAKKTGAQTLITMCPTCTYTIAQANLSKPDQAVECLHYLEALFGVRIEWDIVFYQLNAMWAGEYGPWLNATFFE